MTSISQSKSVSVSEPRFEARARGYFFSINDEVWVLDKNVSVNVGKVSRRLVQPTQDGFLKTLAFYARQRSAKHTANLLERFKHFLSCMESSVITEDEVINYRSTLGKKDEWYLTSLRGFLTRWHDLGYPGVSSDLVRMLQDWRLKGNRKGDAVKRKDPNSGPLTDIELAAFNEGVVHAFERDEISLSDLCICFITSNTGRRPVQISHIRVSDVLPAQNYKGEVVYILRIPRGKQGKGFRASFKSFKMSRELWAVVTEQARNAVHQVERYLGFKLQTQERDQVPLFPDLEVASQLSSPREYRDLIKTDKLHIAANVITKTIKSASAIAGVQSERTGIDLHVNARRFRYTTGTRAAREGFGELVIAELLDQSDTQNSGVYIKNIPEHVKRLDEAVGFHLAPYAQAFSGVLVDTEKEAVRGDDSRSRIRSEAGCAIGTCGEYGFCGANNVPIPCYTCIHFQPWLDGPHQQVYQDLLSERERMIEVTGDIQIAAVLDRSILAVAEVIRRCEKRRRELESVEDLRTSGSVAKDG